MLNMQNTNVSCLNCWNFPVESHLPYARHYNPQFVYFCMFFTLFFTAVSNQLQYYSIIYFWDFLTFTKFWKPHVKYNLDLVTSNDLVMIFPKTIFPFATWNHYTVRAPYFLTPFFTVVYIVERFIMQSG